MMTLSGDTTLTPIVTAALSTLWRHRYHGAANVGGVRYQLLYFSRRVFDLYDPHGPDEIVGEGIEDVDLASVTLGNEYVQIKHARKGLAWGTFIDTLLGFAPVLRDDPTARLTLVTDVRLQGAVHDVVAASSGGRSLPNDAVRKLARAFADAPVTPETVLARLRVEIRPESTLVADLSSAVAEHFAVATGNEELYALAVLADLAARASQRIAVRRDDLETLRVRVETAISYGPVNPAVRDGFVAPLDFPTSDRSDDYYEGRVARPDHIAARLDIPRIALVAQIDETLARVPVCLVLVSSGQGKSTAAYRYAHNHYRPESRFVVSTCRDEADVGQIERFLRARLSLGLPLLVVIDGLSRRTRLWHHLAHTLADAPVSFLVTAREEDWFRYAGETAGFGWSVVRPRLTLDEAERIFRALKERGRVAPGVPSARWAFERVRVRGLLIEFIYLVTHGQLLSERLTAQLSVMDDLNEDPGKFDALRLVSVAQRYGARIRAVDLVRHVVFQRDPDHSLDALKGEYLACEDGYWVGLHPVRSNHLVALMHRALPVEVTVERLVNLLDPDELEAFVADAFSDPDLDLIAPLRALATRCAADPVNLLPRMAAACFEAEERRYFRRHRHLFDHAFDLLGDAGVFLLAAEVMPVGATSHLQNLAHAIGESSGSAALQALAAQFRPRVSPDRLEHCLLTAALACINPVRLAADLPALAWVTNWCRQAHVASAAVDQALAVSRWEDSLLNLPIEDAATVAFALSRNVPDRYRRWLDEHRDDVIGAFKYGTRTFTVTVEGDSIAIGFPVEIVPDAPSLNMQAVTRLFLLHQLFPFFGTYRSDGLFPYDADRPTVGDDTHKEWTPDRIWQAIDTDKNATWCAVCKDAYAADSVTEWLDAWQEARRECLDFVRRLDGCLVAAWRGQDGATRLEALGREFLARLLPQLHRAPLPPAGLATTDRDRLRTSVERWRAAFLNFAHQIVNFPARDTQGARLVRVNLMDAMAGLADLDAAYAHAAHLVGLPVPNATAAREMVAYRGVDELLAFWFEAGRGGLQEPRTAAREWHRARNHAFVASIRLALQLLEAVGGRFVYPTGPLPLDGGLLSALCVGYQVPDFSVLEHDLIIIAAALGTIAPPHHDSMYLIPVVGSQSISGKAWCVVASSARELAQGRVPQGQWAFSLPFPANLGEECLGAIAGGLRGACAQC